MTLQPPVHDHLVVELLRLAVAEDLGDGDVTTLATVPEGLRARAQVVAREPVVACGMCLLEPLAAVMQERGRTEEEADSLALRESVDEGTHLDAGQSLCTLAGTARALLTIERTFLNFLARLSGIATLTSRYVDAASTAGARVRVLDTRKTTPGHRLLEKFAVRCGGGCNHREGLYDAVLIKDNHVAAAGGLAAALTRAKAAAPAGMKIEVECDTLEQVRDALAGKADAILLDNFSPQRVREAVALIDRRARVEISGGVTLKTLPAYAGAGADDVSVGRLTHSAPAVDLSMEISTEP